jgi:hypothetical protein
MMPGGTGGDGGASGATMPGGTGGDSGGDAGTAAGEGGASGAGDGGTGGMNAGDGGDSGTSGLGGASGTGGDAPIYENECTLEVPWECKVCDAQDTCAAATYVNNGDGTISSSCCGLVWQAEIEFFFDTENPFDDCLDRADAAGCYTFDEAHAYCAGLDLAGGGWRVPAAVELQTLMIRDVGPPYLDSEAFPDAPVWDLYWTSSLSDQGSNEAWLGGFGGTFASRRQQSQKHFVRCVRSE